MSSKTRYARLLARHPLGWPLLAAVLAIATLLILISLVVQGGVRDAASRHAGTAAKADATWRCQVGRDRPGRQDCEQRARDNGPALPR